MKIKKRGVTLVELVLTTVVLLILFLMVGGIEFYLLRNTLPFIKTENSDFVIASALQHMERNISAGATWSMPNVNTIDISIPSTTFYFDHSTRTIRYYFKGPDANGKYTLDFYPDFKNSPLRKETVAENIQDVYIGAPGPNSRTLYVQLEGALPTITYYRQGIMLSRFIRLRGLRE